MYGYTLPAIHVYFWDILHHKGSLKAGGRPYLQWVEFKIQAVITMVESSVKLIREY